jgi:nucleotide-binding universal stress UspA family protein
MSIGGRQVGTRREPTTSIHGHSSLGRWVLGSLADKVLGAAEAPVLLPRARGQSRNGEPR